MASEARKWLTCGCLGCVGLIVVVILVVGGVFGTAKIAVNNESVADKTLAPRLPAAVAGSPDTAGRPGRVVLRLTAGEFHIEPADPGEPLRVDARYDENSYELRERFEPGDERWTYEVDFVRRGSMLMSFLKALVGGTGSRIDVFLPVDVPLELELDLSQGGSEIDLGGLWLTVADIEVSQGGFQLEFGEPLREPMERLTIRGSMGGFAIQRVGDASPRKLEVDHRMGGMELDLRGEWRADAEITVRVRQGGGALRLPRDVNIVGLETDRVALRGDEETPRPTLTFSVSADQGELEIVE